MSNGFVNKVQWVVLVGVLAALGLAIRFRAGDLGPQLAIVGISFVAVAVCIALWRHQKALGIVLLAAFTLRLTIAGLDDWLQIFPKADQNGYFLEAKWAAEAWAVGHGAERAWYTAVGAYVHFLGAFFFAFGPSPMLARAVSAMLGLIATALIYRIAASFFDGRVGLAAAALYAAWPSMVYFQGDVLRDPLVHVLVLGLVALLVSRFPWGSLLLVPPIMAALVLLRMPTALVVLVPIAVLLYARLSHRDEYPAFSSAFHGRATPYKRRPRMRNVLMVVSGAFVLLVAFDPVYMTFLKDLGALSDYRAEWATGGSAYLTDRDFDHLYEVILFAPLSAFFFLFTPFPWHIDDTLTMVAFLENILFYYPLVWLSLRAMNRHSHHPVALGPILFLLVGALLYGIVEGNIGTALRHRAQFTWVFIVFAAPAVVRLWDAYAHKVPVVARFTPSPGRPSEDVRRTSVH